MDLNIASLQQAYAASTLTPTDVVNEVHRRVSAYNEKDPGVWIDTVPLADLLARAGELAILRQKNEAEGKPLLALWGVPFSAKNNMDVKGFRTTAGCRDFSYVAERTATCVQRCLDAGGILVGTTNLDQFATGLVGQRSDFTNPRCVFDADYVTGGSSSGCAVSVAAQLVSFGLGTDTGGSIRIPAAYNGIVGAKYTFGLVPATGVVPACQAVDCVCVHSRTVEDARIAFEVLRGFDEDDIYSRTEDDLPRRKAWGSELRYGVPGEAELETLTPEYAGLWKEALGVIDGGGLGLIRSDEFDYAPFEAANELLYGSTLLTQRLTAFKDYIATHGLAKLHPDLTAIFAAAQGASAEQAWEDIFTLQRLKRLTDLAFKRAVDVLVVPSAPQHWTVAEYEADPLVRNKANGKFAQFVNQVDLCAVAVPFGRWVNLRGREMPFSVTFIAPAGRDGELMRLVERFVGAAGKWQSQRNE